MPQQEGSIAGISCIFDHSLQLATAPCAAWEGKTPDISQCVAVVSEGCALQNNFKDTPWQEVIQCNVTAISPTNASLLLAWEIEDWQQNVVVGENSYASIWVAPTAGAQIQLMKSVTTFNHHQINLWDRNLVYHSTVHDFGLYSVWIQIQGNGVFHFDTMSMYNPWRAVGDIGGFAYFVFLAHIAAMIIIGLCMANNSSFLNQTNASGISGNIHDNTGAYTKM